MLFVGSKSVPRSDLAYAAFRVSFLDTGERIVMARQLELAADRSFGYLTQVPFLRHVPPHVQLDLLANTWSKCSSHRAYRANLVDESVLYAACETAAQMVRNEPTTVERFLRHGPVPFIGAIDHTQADALQKFHLDLDNSGNFLLLSQFQDIPPGEAFPLKRKYGIQQSECECMFDVLGRWYVSSGLLEKTRGLLTHTEAEQSRSLFAHRTCPHLD